MNPYNSTPFLNFLVDRFFGVTDALNVGAGRLTIVYAALANTEVRFSGLQQAVERAELAVAEQIIQSDTDLGGNRELGRLIETYSKALDLGYDPGTDELADTFSGLNDADTGDAGVAAAKVELQTDLAEKILISDADLGAVEALFDILTFYVEQIEAGFTPTEDTGAAIADNLAAATVEDAALQALIDDTVSTLQGDQLNIVEINPFLPGDPLDETIQATDGRDVFVLDHEALLATGNSDGPRIGSLTVEGFDANEDQFVFENFDFTNDGILGTPGTFSQDEFDRDAGKGTFVEFGATPDFFVEARIFDTAGTFTNLRADDAAGDTVFFDFDLLPSEYATGSIADETGQFVFYADEMII